MKMLERQLSAVLQAFQEGQSTLNLMKLLRETVDSCPWDEDEIHTYRVFLTSYYGGLEIEPYIGTFLEAYDYGKKELDNYPDLQWVVLEAEGVSWQG